MLFLTVFVSILTLGATSPMGGLQRRANKAVLFNTGQSFLLQPSNSPIVSLSGGVDTYFQGDGNLVVSVPCLSHTPPLNHLTLTIMDSIPPY